MVFIKINDSKIFLVLTLWYRRSEQNFRIALFSIGISLAGSFSGLLAYGY